MVKTVSVADYIVERLATEGINHCFGVAGDYVFPICDAVDSSAKVKWIGCAIELNASYAPDGYARIRGAAMLVTTYGVGELSALNGVMGAKAERSLVFHVVGMPSYQHQRVGKIAHHGDGVFGNFVDLSADAACCHAIINLAQKAPSSTQNRAYIEIIGGKMDMPPALAFAHGRLKAMNGDPV
jgi:indolepyruvate decarboxylase